MSLTVWTYLFQIIEFLQSTLLQHWCSVASVWANWKMPSGILLFWGLFQLWIHRFGEVLDTRKLPLNQFVFQERNLARSRMLQSQDCTVGGARLQDSELWPLFCGAWNCRGEGRSWWWWLDSGCWLLDDFGQNYFCMIWPCDDVLAGKTSTATGPWWLKKMVNIRFLLWKLGLQILCFWSLDPAMLCSSICWWCHRMVPRSQSPVMTSVTHLGPSGSKRLSRSRATFALWCFCSSVSLWGTHFAESFQWWSSLCRIVWTVLNERASLALTSCIHMCGSSFTSLATAAALHSFETLFGCPFLACQCCSPFSQFWIHSAIFWLWNKAALTPTTVFNYLDSDVWSLVFDQTSYWCILCIALKTGLWVDIMCVNMYVCIPKLQHVCVCHF